MRQGLTHFFDQGQILVIRCLVCVSYDVIMELLFSDDLIGELDEYIQRYLPAKVKVIRNRKRQGLIRGRMIGAFMSDPIAYLSLSLLSFPPMPWPLSLFSFLGTFSEAFLASCRPLLTKAQLSLSLFSASFIRQPLRLTACHLTSSSLFFLIESYLPGAAGSLVPSDWPSLTNWSVLCPLSLGV